MDKQTLFKIGTARTDANFANLLNNADMSDVELQLEKEEKIVAHKYVQQN